MIQKGTKNLKMVQCTKKYKIFHQKKSGKILRPYYYYHVTNKNLEFSQWSYQDFLWNMMIVLRLKTGQAICRSTVPAPLNGEACNQKLFLEPSDHHIKNA